MCTGKRTKEEAGMKNLGFGMMRLPVKSSDQTDFDYEQLNQMVDEFIGNGYTYFDTSYVYHNGKSQEATRKSVVERHPRDSFTVATKFPTMILKTEDQIEPIFQSQLDDLGVDYIDYYLLHIIRTDLYDGIDGKGGVVKTTHLFDHEKKWKEEGKIRHMGFSYHSSAVLLDRILTEHPEVDFVQIALNAVDCRSEFVQSKACYDVIRKHGKQVVIMESVKGGELAHLPAEAEAILRKLDPDRSDASWALRYAQQLDGVIAALSGMSTLEQVKDNVKTANETGPLSAEEMAAYEKAIDLFLAQGPLSKEEIEKYKGLTYIGVPVTGILQEYNTLKILRDPTFTDDGNYLKQTLAECSHLDLFNDKLPEDKVILPDGTDRTAFVKEAFDYCKSVSW